MKRMKFLFVTVALLLFVSAVPDKTTTIFIIGDSTAANKDISGGKQERGWGMVLQSYFDDNIVGKPLLKYLVFITINFQFSIIN